MYFINSCNCCIPSFYKPRAFDACMPMWDFSTRGTWTHADKNKASMDQCESVSSFAVFAEVELL